MKPQINPLEELMKKGEVGTEEVERETSRKVIMNETSETYPNNQIKSTSSNFLTFIPLNLLGQLRETANIYFIVIAILQSIPATSVTGGQPTVLMPLAFVMLTVMVKDAYEEIGRYRKDKAENERQCQYWNGTSFSYESWENLKVGHVIKVKRDQLIPCDALIIQTSDPQLKGFIETKGLDGETNLKLKKSFLVNSSTTRASRVPEIYKKHYAINCEGPTPFLQKFSGSIIVENEELPLNADNLILRGCFLRNTAEVKCVCIYTGPDTKVILNSAKFAPKRSKLMDLVSKLVFEIFIWQIIIALVTSLLNMLLQGSHSQFMSYIPSSNFWILAATWWLMMTYFVPISLMVTMEIIKLFQGMLLAQDSQGYSKDYDCFASANSTSVNENLGQIKYVFTDKTGTLTKNEMHFKKFYCNGQTYGEVEDDDSAELKRRMSLCQNVSFKDLKFRQNLASPKIQNALKVLYLCHNIFVEKEGGKLVYNSDSPDEIALINFAKLYGKELLGEQNNNILIADGTGSQTATKRFRKLRFIAFNSDRKKMSVIVQDPDSGLIEILCKGADSSIAEILRPGDPDLHAAQAVVDRLSVEGLRTLFLARRTLSQQQFDQWDSEYKKAASTLKNREKLLDAVNAKIEINMELVGATAIQDRLQDDVVNTIRTMRLAGMSFYILTGDKKQTAINIGRSCGLIQDTATICDIPEYDKAKDHQWRLEMLRLKEIKDEKVYLLNASKPIPPDLPLHQTICYRCTPVQKQNVVMYVKGVSPFLTMAVGDGANDVNMITKADVGIGVKGREGTEAARVADFVVGEFKHISLLTLYYGREWYRKNCKMVCYSFWKNWYHVFSVLTFGAFTYFSAVIIFDIYLYEFFNTFFATMPIIAYALFDEELSYRQIMKYPDLYQPGPDNEHFNQSVIGKTIGASILFGIVSLLVLFYLIDAEVLTEDGLTSTLRQSGAILFINIIMVVNFKILIMSKGLRPITVIFVLGSIALYWIIYLIFYGYANFKVEWTTAHIIFVHLVLLFFLTFIDLAYTKYMQFRGGLTRMDKSRKLITGIMSMFNIEQD